MVGGGGGGGGGVCGRKGGEEGRGGEKGRSDLSTKTWVSQIHKIRVTQSSKNLILENKITHETVFSFTVGSLSCFFVCVTPFSVCPSLFNDFRIFLFLFIIHYLDCCSFLFLSFHVLVTDNSLVFSCVSEDFCFCVLRVSSDCSKKVEEENAPPPKE